MTNPTDIPTPRTQRRKFWIIPDGYMGQKLEVVYATEYEELERENVRLKEALSSGLCSAHQEPDPLNCPTCNMITWHMSSIETLMESVGTVTKERDDLRVEVERLKNWREIADQNLEKTICELREALEAAKAGLWDLEKMGAAQKAVTNALFLTPSEISEKWVKREVLERCLKALCENVRSDGHDLKCAYDEHGDNPDSDYCTCNRLGKETIALARIELGKGEK